MTAQDDGTGPIGEDGRSARRRTGRWRAIGRRIVGWLPRRDLFYWLTAAMLLALSTWASPFIDAHLSMQKERDWLFQRLTLSPTNPTTAGEGRLVLIRDDAFWLGDLHHRSPTDRGYLARIVRALNTAEASVIALDFDLRTPQPNRPAALGDYAAVDSYQPYRLETDDLVRAIGKVAGDRKVVLAKAIAGPDNGPFRLLADAYQPYGLCTRLSGDGVWSNPGAPQFPLSATAAANISCGYIALMDDARRIPPPARIVGQGGRLDAFPAAIVRARDPAAVPALQARPYFGAYVSGDLIDSPLVSVSAADLLRDPIKARAVLQGRVVVVGAAWHSRGFGSGPPVDLHPTPIGLESGVLIHESLADAMLSHRAFPGLDGAGLRWVELATGVAAAIAFAAISGFWKRAAAVVGAMLALLALQWLILQLFAVFFDAFVPVFAVGLHALADRLVGESPPHAPPMADRFAIWLRHGRMAVFGRGAADVKTSPPTRGDG